MRWLRRIGWAGVLAGALCLGTSVAADSGRHRDRRHGSPRVCSGTAELQYRACQHEIEDDQLTASAICLNETERDERRECLADAASEKREARKLCREQRSARRELCDSLGEDAYAPDFDPADFESDFASPANPNPLYPLAFGHRWVYAGGDEVVTVEVLAKTKSIEGVTCVVVNDLVEADGDPIEDTDDWVALRRDGEVVYCGESVRDFEVFEGDSPPEPELVDIAGSFKAGRDGARSGTLFPAVPRRGDVYRQEWAAGEAEDAAVVLSTGYRYGDDPELDEHVPRALAELLCDGDCVVTGDFTPLEPDVFERKYYAPGIGRFLEVKPEDGEVSQLVDCNLDARCGALPRP